MQGSRSGSGSSSGVWLDWIRRLRAISQTGLEYGRDAYDRERYEELRELSHLMLGALLDAPPERVTGFYLPDTGYPTPKVDVRAGVFRDGTVLLVREAADGRWSLPGGWGDEHESPRGSIEREVLEESGFVVRAERLVALKDRSLHPYAPPRLERVYKLFFLCELIGGAPQASLETTAAEFFPIGALPELSAGRTLAADVDLLWAHRQDPTLDCWFD